MTGKFEILDTDCFRYYPGIIPALEADTILACLWKELDWRQQEITLFGRKMLQPRLTAWYGEPEARYSYSGLQLEPLAWHPLLNALKSRLESFTGATFNSVLANAYRDGSDSMGWHSDDEKELGHQPTIASLSFGDERRFLVREKGQRSSAMVLQHGSLLVMKGDSQRRFQHSLPKTRRAAGVRINLTYRMVRDQTAFAPGCRNGG
jgi:alkylated DNA repair dioxygenase AlkB